VALIFVLLAAADETADDNDHSQKAASDVEPSPHLLVVGLGDAVGTHASSDGLGELVGPGLFIGPQEV